MGERCMWRRAVFRSVGPASSWMDVAGAPRMPPPIVLPSAGAGIWAPWLVRPRVNGAAGGTDANPLLADESTGISILSGNGIEDVGWLEVSQFGGSRGWIAALGKALRALDRFMWSAARIRRRAAISAVRIPDRTYGSSRA